MINSHAIFDANGWGKSWYTGDDGSASAIAKAGAVEVPEELRTEPAKLLTLTVTEATYDEDGAELTPEVQTVALATAEDRWDYDQSGYDGAALRSAAHRDEADPLLSSYFAYLEEGDTIKANVQKTLWTAKRAEIRERISDIPPAYVAPVVEEPPEGV